MMGARRGKAAKNAAAIEGIRERLFALQDVGYRDFQKKLIPTVPADRMIGVRTPALRALAKELCGSAEAAIFLETLPHDYFDENQLHAFLISLEKDAEVCFAALEQFLPYIDNWATCDQLSPKIFKGAKHREALLSHIRTWIASDRVYIVRFAIGMLMQHFLDDAFSPAYLAMVADLRSEEYYVNKEIAWYFATALAKQWDAALPFLAEERLAVWTHNKTIQKAVESYRITKEQKALLRGMRR